MQRLVVNTLFQEVTDHHNQKVGSRETPKLGPCWKSRPVACMVNMESRLELCLWAETTLTPGSEFVMDQIGLWWIWTTMKHKFLKISTKNMRLNWVQKDLHADPRQKQNHKEGNLLAIHQESFRWTQGIGLILNPGKHSLSLRSFEESNSSSSSFTTIASRRGLENQRKSSESVPTNSSLVWRSMESMLGSREGERSKKEILHWWLRNTCLFPSSSMTFRTHSYWSFIAYNVVTQSGFLQHICHIGCAFNLHSIINSGLTPGGQNSSKRQTVLFLPFDPRDKSHEDPWKDWLESTTSCTIPAQCMEKTSRRGILDRHRSCDSERIDIPSDSIECNHPSRNTSSLLYSKSC